MSTITVHPSNQDQETAIRLFLDALHVEYKATEQAPDDTTYLSSSEAMKSRLNEAMKQDADGKGISISLDDIWK